MNPTIGSETSSTRANRCYDIDRNYSRGCALNRCDCSGASEARLPLMSAAQPCGQEYSAAPSVQTGVRACCLNGITCCSRCALTLWCSKFHWHHNGRDLMIYSTSPLAWLQPLSSWCIAKRCGCNLCNCVMNSSCVPFIIVENGKFEFDQSARKGRKWSTSVKSSLM